MGLALDWHHHIEVFHYYICIHRWFNTISVIIILDVRYYILNNQWHTDCMSCPGLKGKDPRVYSTAEPKLMITCNFLLQNTAVKYLFHPLLRHVDRLSPVCTLTGVFYAATYPNQTVCIIHKLFKDVNPVHLHTLTHASMLESCVKTAFSEWRTALTSRKQWVGRATVNGCMSAVGIYSSCLSRDHWVKPP